MRIVYWGTYDTGKPRNRIIIKGLKENGVEVEECRGDIWAGIEDKSQLCGWKKRLAAVFRWLACYPILIFKYLCTAKHDALMVGYLGVLDVIVIWPFAKIRGVPIVWDAFLSLYDTLLYDRKVISLKNPLAHIVFFVEWLACRLSNKVILDTDEHAKYFIATYNLPPDKVEKVFVGTEIELFSCAGKSGEEDKKQVSTPFTVLFYGQFIPLHGIDVVVRAAKLSEKNGFNWIIIGKGQESDRISRLCRELAPNNLQLIEWVPYEELINWINRADVGLGIFGDTEKAKRVIPNKVFQLLAAGCPIITGDTPAARELLRPSEMISFVPVADPVSLAKSVEEMACSVNQRTRKHDPEITKQIQPLQIGAVVQGILGRL